MANIIKRNILKGLLVVLLPAIMVAGLVAYVPVPGFKMQEANALAPFNMLLAAAGSEVVAPTFHLNAVDLNGSDESVGLTSSTSTQGYADTFSLSTWVEPAAQPANVHIYQTKPTSLDINRVFVEQLVQELRVILWDSAGTLYKSFVTTNSPFATGVKSHVGFTIDGSDTGDPLLLYLNGVVIDSADITETTDTTGTRTDTARNITIGRTSGTSSYFDGKISRVDIWDVVLDGSNFLQLYNSGTGFGYDLRDDVGNYNQSANLVHQWLLGKDSGNIGDDLVSSGAVDLTDLENVTADDIVDFETGI